LPSLASVFAATGDHIATTEPLPSSAALNGGTVALKP
jgi:hypothetical protein